MRIALLASNGQYVRANDQGSDPDVGNLTADRPEPGLDEIFIIEKCDDGRIALRTQGNPDGNRPGRYWSAEESGGGALHANRAAGDDETAPEHLRTAIGPWEQFKPSVKIADGASLSLQTWDGLHYVCCEKLTPGAPLNATRTDPQEWETFLVRMIEADTVPVPEPGPGRTGQVVSDGRAVRDDQGRKSFWGMTLFWAPRGWRQERDRIIANIDWCSSKGVDYVRMLGEVEDWGPENGTFPSWPDYNEVMAGVSDYAFSKGVRTQLTVIGGGTKKQVELAHTIASIYRDRKQVLAYVEAVNEWARLNKATPDQMREMGQILKAEFALVALSQPGGMSWDDMKKLMKDAGANVWIEHTDRNDADNHWRQVRQDYDFKDGSPWTASDQEGPGPQSSIAVLENPLQLGMKRYLGHMAGCGFFTLHAGAGVTGRVDPGHGRPANLWETNNIDEIVRVVKGVEQWLPDNVQNWKIVNNGREDHPLPLNPAVNEEGAGFWAGNGCGSVNKNYAALGPDGKFVEVLCGVKAHDDGQEGRPNGPDVQLQWVGTARRSMHVQAIDPVTGQVVDERDLSAGGRWDLPGRKDTMVGYIVIGQHV